MSADLVADAASLAALCERVRAAERVGLDTEFHSERSYAPKLMVVQLSFDDGAVIVDPLAVPDLSSLMDALDETLIVGHALSSDLRIFAHRFGHVPKHVFDCQVAASFLGYGMQISLADLVHDLRNIRLAKTQTVSDWSIRPFSAAQIDYLVDDVVHLLPMQQQLEERLTTCGRLSWAHEESDALTDPSKYERDERRLYLRIPGAMKMNRRELGVLFELGKMRDRMASDRDVPPKYILPDDVLGGLATLRPKREEQLAQLRRLEAGARRSLGSTILAAVAAGEAIPDEELPQRVPRPLGNARETIASLLAVLVGEIASANQVPTGLLAPRAALERVARELPQGMDALRATLDLSEWRTSLIAEPIYRLLSGQDALRIEGYTDGDPKIRSLT